MTRAPGRNRHGGPGRPGGSSGSSGRAIRGPGRQHAQGPVPQASSGPSRPGCGGQLRLGNRVTASSDWHRDCQWLPLFSGMSSPGEEVFVSMFGADKDLVNHFTLPRSGTGCRYRDNPIQFPGQLFAWNQNTGVAWGFLDFEKSTCQWTNVLNLKDRPALM